MLSCILIESHKEITLKATNLEAGIEIRVAGEVIEQGTLAVPAAVFSQTVRSISGDKVTLKAEEGNLLIESRGTKTLIKAIPHTEFPVLPTPAQRDGVAVPKDKFLRGLQSTMYAASPSMIRPELGSVFASIKQDGITFVATDSFRLAEKRVVGISPKEEMDLLIPLKHVNELSYILERVGEESIVLMVEESQMVVAAGPLRYISRVIDAQFPNYREIIPKTFLTEATVLKSEFGEMLKKARVFAGNDQHIGLHLYPKKKIFSATARSENVGEMSDSIDAALTGEDLDINFHIGYLAECLSSIESDSVQLGFSGPGRALVLRGVSDSSYMYLVMPLNR